MIHHIYTIVALVASWSPFLVSASGGNPSDSEPQCPVASEETTFLPYPGDCTKYYECYAGNGYLYSCPKQLWWNQQKSECDYPGPYCDNSQPGDDPSPGATCSTDDGNYAYAGDCTKFWNCAGGIGVVEDCPEGLWYDEGADRCDYPGPFCGSYTGPINYTTPPPMCVGVTESATFPYPQDCSKYVVCVSAGVGYVEDCPGGLEWHQEIGQCDYPENANCVNSKRSFLGKLLDLMRK